MKDKCKINLVFGCVDYSYLSDGTLLRRRYDTRSHQHYWHLTNNQGSVMAVVDGRGKVVQRSGLYPSGTPFVLPVDIAADTVSMRLGAVSDRLHIGNRWQSHSGLNWYDNTARMHDPLLLRFTTQDPLAGKNSDTSPYAFCHGNPVNRIDPSGLTDYFNQKGDFIQTIDDEKSDRAMVFIDNKNKNDANSAIQEGKCMVAPSMDVVKTMRKTYDLTAKTGHEHGFEVGRKGTISQIVEGTDGVVDNSAWIKANKDLADAGDEISYDVHTHPRIVYKDGWFDTPDNNTPSPIDISNARGDSPNVVLGYRLVDGFKERNVMGGTPPKEIVEYIRFYNGTGVLNSEEYKFSTFETAVKKIHKWKPKTK